MRATWRCSGSPEDRGAGQPVVFSHGWPLNADSPEGRKLHLAEHGFRVSVQDRRGHGRWSKPCTATTPIGAAATLEVHPGAPHGITDTHRAEPNADLLAFAWGGRALKNTTITTGTTGTTNCGCSS